MSAVAVAVVRCAAAELPAALAGALPYDPEATLGDVLALRGDVLREGGWTIGLTRDGDGHGYDARRDRDGETAWDHGYATREAALSEARANTVLACDVCTTPGACEPDDGNVCERCRETSEGERLRDAWADGEAERALVRAQDRAEANADRGVVREGGVL